MNCPYLPNKVHFQASPYNFTALRKNFKIIYRTIISKTPIPSNNLKKGIIIHTYFFYT